MSEDGEYGMDQFEGNNSTATQYSPETELTQHYLQLLRQGRLSRIGGIPGPSTQAGSCQTSHPAPVPPPWDISIDRASNTGTDDEECLHTVHRTEKERLKFLTDSMAYQPLAIPRGSSRTNSRGSNRPGTNQSWASQVVQGHSHPQRHPPMSPSATQSLDRVLPLQPSPDLSDRPATSVSSQQWPPFRRRSSSGHSSPSVQSHQSTLSSLNIRSKTCPGRPIYSPGPGAYSPPTDRYGSWGAQNKPKTVFGNAPQRPDNVCASAVGSVNVVSPGPAYLPNNTSTTARPTSPRFSFGKKDIGSRTDLTAGHSKNSPLWNPGPGKYTVQRLANGVYCETGANSPHAIFGAAPKLMTPQTNLSATPYVSARHSYKENVGMHSPGPARYNADASPTHTSPSKYSMAGKTPSYFDAFSEPGRQLSPGPVYKPAINCHADRPWNSQSAIFGKGSKFWDPELNLSATPFISHTHAHHVNKGIHAPGVGSYKSKKPQPRVQSTFIGSGPKDRFYDRFEPGRLG